jgi:hypothetical protein
MVFVIISPILSTYMVLAYNDNVEGNIILATYSEILLFSLLIFEFTLSPQYWLLAPQLLILQCSVCGFYYSSAYMKTLEDMFSFWAHQTFCQTTVFDWKHSTVLYSKI